MSMPQSDPPTASSVGRCCNDTRQFLRVTRENKEQKMIPLPSLRCAPILLRQDRFEATIVATYRPP